MYRISFPRYNVFPFMGMQYFIAPGLTDIGKRCSWTKVELFEALFDENAKSEKLENSTNNLIFKTFLTVLSGSITYLRNSDCISFSPVDLDQILYSYQIHWEERFAFIYSYDVAKAFMSKNTIYFI